MADPRLEARRSASMTSCDRIALVSPEDAPPNSNWSRRGPIAGINPSSVRSSLWLAFDSRSRRWRPYGIRKPGRGECHGACSRRRLDRGHTFERCFGSEVWNRRRCDLFSWASKVRIMVAAFREVIYSPAYRPRGQRFLTLSGTLSNEACFAFAGPTLRSCALRKMGVLPATPVAAGEGLFSASSRQDLALSGPDGL